MPEVRLQVDGTPAPKGSRIPGRRKDGSIFTRPASKREAPWVEQVALVAKVNRPSGQVLEPPYDIDLRFTLPSPKKPKYSWPTKDGDLDKLVRAVLDGLVHGGLLVDDRHVASLSARKEFAAGGPGGVVVTVSAAAGRLL